MPSPGTILNSDGTLAAANGVTEEEADDTGEVPFEFLATTLNVTGVPYVKPITAIVRRLPTVTEIPEEDITV